MKCLLPILALSLFGAVLFAEDAPKSVADQIRFDKSFRDALTYRFALELYWKHWLIASPLFDEWGAPKKTRMTASLIGKTISGKVLRYGNTYCIDFGDSLPEHLRNIGLLRNQNGEWSNAHSNLKDKKPGEVICGKYDFKIPVDFPSIAAKTDASTEQMLNDLKISLDNFVNESCCPPGEKHFFISPLNKFTFPDFLTIYYVEEKTLMWVRENIPFKEISCLQYDDFSDDTLLHVDAELFVAYHNSPDDADTQLEKRILTGRAYSNVTVANCVRDGKLITVVKRPPSYWSKFKAWLKSKFKRPEAQDGR
jgi:hypothetical protein